MLAMPNWYKHTIWVNFNGIFRTTALNHFRSWIIQYNVNYLSLLFTVRSSIDYCASYRESKTIRGI